MKDFFQLVGQQVVLFSPFLSNQHFNRTSEAVVVLLNTCTDEIPQYFPSCQPEPPPSENSLPVFYVGGQKSCFVRGCTSTMTQERTDPSRLLERKRPLLLYDFHLFSQLLHAEDALAPRVAPALDIFVHRR